MPTIPPYLSLEIHLLTLLLNFHTLKNGLKVIDLSLIKIKTEEIVFRRPKIRHFLTPPPLSGISQVDEVKLLGVYLTNLTPAAPYYSSADHVNHLLIIGSRRLFLLFQLKN